MATTAQSLQQPNPLAQQQGALDLLALA